MATLPDLFDEALAGIAREYGPATIANQRLPRFLQALRAVKGRINWRYVMVPLQQAALDAMNRTGRHLEHLEREASIYGYSPQRLQAQMDDLLIAHAVELVMLLKASNTVVLEVRAFQDGLGTICSSFPYRSRNRDAVCQRLREATIACWGTAAVSSEQRAAATQALAPVARELARLVAAGKAGRHTAERIRKTCNDYLRGQEPRLLALIRAGGPSDQLPLTPSTGGHPAGGLTSDGFATESARPHGGSHYLSSDASHAGPGVVERSISHLDRLSPRRRAIYARASGFRA
ncbi:hypothetical protein JCM10908_002680 [Rhodotorula pacifica]|uniref:uncharacterized protein n=1 Tax=Rhodotorula pacifica TaxID=1495444 RepID=UPI00316BFDC9